MFFFFSTHPTPPPALYSCKYKYLLYLMVEFPEEGVCSPGMEGEREEEEEEQGEKEEE